MDDLEPAQVEGPFWLRTVMHTMHKAGTDLKTLTEQETELVAAIYKLRDALRGRE